MEFQVDISILGFYINMFTDCSCSPPGTITLLWWGGLGPLMILGAMLIGAGYPRSVTQGTLNPGLGKGP